MFRVCLFLSGLLFVGTAAGVYLGFYAHPTNWDFAWHAGKSRTEWLQIIETAAGTERDEAIEAMVSFGPAVVPHLIHKIRESGPQVRDAAMVALTKIGEPALEPLRQAHHDPRYPGHRSRFREAIVRIGPPIAVQVATWLESESIFDQRLAIQILSEWSVGPELVLPRLGKLMNNDEEAHNVIRLLARLGEPGVEPLLTCLQSDSIEARTAALIALGEMGRDAKTALPTLLDLREYSDDGQVELIDQTIRKIEKAGR